VVKAFETALAAPTRRAYPSDIPYCSIVPPYILRNIAERGDDEDRVRALAALEMSRIPRTQRQVTAVVAGQLLLARRVKRRTIYDAEGTQDLPGRTVRIEGARRTGDAAVDEAYEHAGLTYDYFRRAHDRRSLDDRGMRLESTVHFGRGFTNAHWDGRQMIYGDGDGKYFHRFTRALDVVAHEMAHGVTQFAAGLAFSGEGGALAEHFSDIFAILTTQHHKPQTVARADWTIGSELFTERVEGDGIRSLKAPGTAYDDDILGRDPQPSHMRDFVRTSADDRGVHINSGIPNHAFYQFAANLGGRPWDVAGRIWYAALTRELGPRSRFQHCADATWKVAGDLFGRGSEPQDAILAAWRAVGIDVAEKLRAETPRTRRAPRTSQPELMVPLGAAELPHLV
jgi:Zn-dependent metalloprotease